MKDMYQGKPNKGELLIPSIVGLHYRLSIERLFTIKELDDFTNLYENPTTSEAQIHLYLKQNPKFLYALGAYETSLSEVFFGDKNIYQNSIGKLRIDFFLKHTSGYWDFVELKSPHIAKSLIVGDVSRRRFSVAVQDAIAQVRVYLDELAKPEIQHELRKIGIKLIRPQAWIIIGRSENLPTEERRILEAELPRPKLLTYDDLIDLVKQRLLVITPLFIVPSLPVNMTTAAELYRSLSPNWRRNITWATELLGSLTADEYCVRRITGLIVEPITFVAENWDKGVVYFTSDDGDDRCIAQLDYSELTSYIEVLENHWECRGLKKFLGDTGRHSWQFNIDFKQLIHQVEAQVTAFLFFRSR